jgi:hypothetical protein
MEEVIDPKTGGDYVDFDVEDPDEEKLNSHTEIKTNDKPLSERGMDQNSNRSGKKPFIVKV